MTMQRTRLRITLHIEEGKTFHLGSVVITGLSLNAEKHLRDAWPIPQGELFDKGKYEEFLTKLQAHSTEIFRTCRFTMMKWVTGCSLMKPRAPSMCFWTSSNRSQKQSYAVLVLRLFQPRYISLCVILISR